jgi:hypothetical protein
MATHERLHFAFKAQACTLWMCSTASSTTPKVSNDTSSALLSGNDYSRYPTKTFGFSVAGKWPTPFIAWCLPPVIFSQVAWPISGVLLQSYSPVNMYTGHFLVSMLDMRLRPSHPPAKTVSLGSLCPVPFFMAVAWKASFKDDGEAYCVSVS